MPTTTTTPRTVAKGALVVVPSCPARGVGRVERMVPDADPPQVRVFFYDDGTFGVFAHTDVIPAPPGVWDKAPARQAGTDR